MRIAAGHDAAIEQLQAIFQHLADGVFLVSVSPGPEFVYEAFNRQIEKWAGGSLSSLRGRRLDEVLPAQDAAYLREIYRRCVLTGKTQRYEEAPSALRGALSLYTTLIPVMDAQGNVVRIVGVSRDITEHKRSASALLESQEMFAQAFRHGPYAKLIVRMADGAYVDVNAAFEQLCECKREGVLGIRSAELRIWPDVDQLHQLIDAVRVAGGVRDFAAQLETFQGSLRDVLVSAHQIMLGGEPHMIATVRDITQTLDIERAKSALESQLRQAQKLEALGTLAGGIAHDFNNILGAMVAFIDLIRIDVNDRMSVLDHVSELKSAAQRARDLVQQILTFSRTQKPTRSVTKLDYGARDAIKLLRASLASNVSIESLLDEGAPQVLADPSQVHQIVMNLGTNALHAMRERGGRLEIRVEPCVVDEELARARPDLRPGRYARLTVTDTGHGMDEATQKRIFEPFFTTKRQGEGTGLGLAVVHGVVRDHDGAINVESRVGHGTRVEVHVPEHLGDDVAQAPPVLLPRGNGERLLVVDDEEALCVSLTQLLTRLGYQVVSRGDPQAALELYRTAPQDYALVLTDLTMPGMSGLELSQHILALNPRARVVLMSGFSGTWTPATVRALGLLDMLVKPLTAAALAGGVAQALKDAR